jgi:hypothetical protein
MGAGDIILGDGVFAINGTDIALTRGGGQFTIEREYREIEADGDYGAVKGRVRKIRSVAKLTVNALSLLDSNIPKMYAATQINTSGGTKTITATEDITNTQYQDAVTWTGTTKDGRAVIITLQNAINMDNPDWALTDKEEIVAAITYTATYLESARKTEPWKIEFVTPTPPTP